MYTIHTTVGYSRLNRKGIVPFYEILNYLQDCSTAQSESLGVGMEFLTAQNKAWVLLANKIQIFGQLKLGDEIEVGTCPTDFGKVTATRQFFIKDKQGNFLVKAETLWSLIDIRERMPIRILEEDAKAYIKEQAFESIKVSRKMKFAGEKQKAGQFQIPKTYIDTNGHVNNADYLRAAEEFLNDNCFRQIEIVYNQEALEGDVIKVFTYKEENGMGMSFEDQEGVLHTQMKFIK